MRPHCYISALAVISLCGAAAAQPVRWQRYEIPETGVSVDVPTSVFNSDAGQTEVGYGRRFASVDRRANLTVQSVPNKTGDTPATFLAKKKPPQGIEYKRGYAPVFRRFQCSQRQNLVRPLQLQRPLHQLRADQLPRGRGATMG